MFEMECDLTAGFFLEAPLGGSRVVYCNAVLIVTNPTVASTPNSGILDGGTAAFAAHLLPHACMTSRMETYHYWEAVGSCFVL